jgi:hypothetical protein
LNGYLSPSTPLTDCVRVDTFARDSVRRYEYQSKPACPDPKKVKAALAARAAAKKKS